MVSFPLPVLSLSSSLLISPLKCLHFRKHGVNSPRFTQTSLIAGLENEQQEWSDDRAASLMGALGVNRKERSFFYITKVFVQDDILQKCIL